MEVSVLRLAVVHTRRLLFTLGPFLSASDTCCWEEPRTSGRNSERLFCSIAYLMLPSHSLSLAHFLSDFFIVADDSALVKSQAHVPKSSMDKQTTSNGTVPGVSIRMGPVTTEMDIDEPATNGKRKARNSVNGKSYKDESSSEDDIPLVRDLLMRCELVRIF